MVNLRSFWTFGIFIPATVVLGTAALVVSLFDKSGNGYRRLARVWSRIALWLSGTTVEVIGAENLKSGGVYIIASNHASMFDIPLVLAHLNTNLRIVAKAELARVPFMGWSMRRGDFILVRREHARDAMKSLEAAEEKLRAGKSVFFFADGTRSDDGRIKPFKRGAFMLAAKTGVPVLPVTILGSHKIIPKGTFKVIPGKVLIIIAPPVILPASNGIRPNNALITGAPVVMTGASVVMTDALALMTASYNAVRNNYEKYGSQP